MNSLRRFLGVVWILLGPAAVIFMLSQAFAKVAIANTKVLAATDEATKALASAAKLNVQLQWGIIIGIFVPIAFGLIIFGLYSMKGEYDRS
jgi:hypothetical protein